MLNYFSLVALDYLGLIDKAIGKILSANDIAVFLLYGTRPTRIR